MAQRRLEDCSLSELQERAAALKIKGRSKMRRGELIEAIRRAWGNAGTITKRDAAYRERQKKRGFVHVRVFVPQGHQHKIHELAAALREQYPPEP